MKTLITIVLFLCIFISACGEDKISSSSPQPQDVIVNVSYSGTANSVPFEEYPVKIFLDDAETSQSLSIHDFNATLDQLESGYTYTISNRKPGNYSIDAHLDWSRNGTLNNYEPSSDPVIFELDGYEDVDVNIRLLDRTEPDDLGWIEGTLSYFGNETGTHHLYIVIQDLNYNTIKEVKLYGLFGTGIDFNDPEYYYGIPKSIPPGGPYRVVAFWDINNNGNYDNDPIGDYLPIMISPGLPTVDVDIELN